MSLYRKYRPQRFEDLIGQDHVAVTLRRAVETDKVTHSYLFAGPRGTGKTTVARILARAVNCTAKSGQPCGKCLSCKTIAGGQSVDILEIDAASNRGIDEIRELRDKVRFAPSYGKYKVYIIDEVHMLTKEAFNALLKTLEEPPAHAIFILATTEAHKVPVTIVSRCQRYDFRRATLQSVLQLLEKVAKAENIKAEAAARALLARAADGAYRDALTLLEQMAGEETEITAEMVRGKLGLIAEPLMWQLLGQIVDGDKVEALKTYNKLGEQGIDWKYLSTGLMRKLRQALFYTIAPDVIANDLTPEESRHLQKLVGTIDEGQIVELINLFMRAEAELRFTSLPELPLGAAIIEYFNNGESTKSEAPNPKQIPNIKKEPKNQNNINQSSTESVIPTETEGSLSEGKKRDCRLNEAVGQASTIARNDIQQGRVDKDEIASSSKIHRIGTPRNDTVADDNLVPVDGGKWQEIVSIIKKTNTTLADLLKQSHPYLQKEKLIIEVPYAFWEDRIKAKKNSEAICAAACEALGQAVECAIPKSNGDLKKKINEQTAKESQKVKKDIEEVFG